MHLLFGSRIESKSPCKAALGKGRLEEDEDGNTKVASPWSLSKRSHARTWEILSYVDSHLILDLRVLRQRR
jgi:hypothetical protein